MSATLNQDATAAEITEAAQHAASALRAAHGQVLLRSLLEDVGVRGRAASGVPAVQRALRAHAVDLLLLSPTFVRAEAAEAEEAVRAALLQGAEVEVLSGDAAVRLDQVANGVGARLRFALE
jgi:peptide subunit release factor 1 (eRF1)